MFSIQVFADTQTEVTSFVEDSSGVIWFHAGHIGEILDFTNPYRYLPTVLESHEYKEVKTGVGRPSLFVREEGCYLLVMKSKSVFADRFQRWLAYEVLPQIRKTGSFNGVPNTDSEGSEFWQLIDGARSRNLDPGQTIDLHKRYKKSEDAPPIAKSRKAIPQSVNQKAETSDLEMVEALQRLVSRRPDLLVEGGVTARVIRQNTRRLGKGRDAILASLKCLERSGHGVIRCLPKGSVVFVLR